jgi:hypothetical protein
MERVSVLHGINPVLLVAPHGFNDTYTNILTEAAAKECKSNAVINNCWERSAKVDVLNDQANCNKISHCMHDVVKDEFYDPIVKKTNALMNKHPQVYVFHIHGCGNDIRKKAGENLSVVIGWGDGKPARPTARGSMRNLFTYVVDNDKLWTPAQAGKGSMFAGWDQGNLLQMWRPYKQSGGVDALQLEFVTATRKTKADAELSGVYLGSLISKFLFLEVSAYKPPKTYQFFRVNI